MKTKAIERMAGEIKAKLSNGTLFGEPIDFEDNDSVIVSAYNLALYEENLKHTKDLNFLHYLHGGGAV